MKNSIQNPEDHQILKILEEGHRVHLLGCSGINNTDKDIGFNNLWNKHDVFE